MTHLNVCKASFLRRIGCTLLLSATTGVLSSPPPNLLFRVPFDAESMLAMVGRGRRDYRYERLDDNAPKRPVFAP